MLELPKYKPNTKKTECKIGLAVESMQRHTTDEGWQIFAGLEKNGYTLCGYNLYHNLTNVDVILEKFDPTVMVIQDKREWDVKPRDFREPKARFHNVQNLKLRNDIFKLTILKDAHHNNDYHEESAREMGVHAWIVYYDLDIVKELAPYVRKSHLIRTYHTLDSDLVPDMKLCFANQRKDIILSGAVSPRYYPLRHRLIEETKNESDVTYIKHPGYHKEGTCTPNYLRLLSTFKVAICTASVLQYALRKIIEATAAGCIVVTDLKERLPHIDGNLVRIQPDMSTKQILDICRNASNLWNFERQVHYSELAKTYYDYRYQCKLLSENIDIMRKTWPL